MRLLKSLPLGFGLFTACCWLWGWMLHSGTKCKHPGISSVTEIPQKSQPSMPMAPPALHPQGPGCGGRHPLPFPVTPLPCSLRLRSRLRKTNTNTLKFKTLKGRVWREHGHSILWSLPRSKSRAKCIFQVVVKAIANERLSGRGTPRSDVEDEGYTWLPSYTPWGRSP